MKRSRFELIAHRSTREECVELAAQLESRLSGLLPGVRFSAMRSQLGSWDTLAESQRLDLCRAIGWRSLMFLERDWVLNELDVPGVSKAPDAFVDWAKKEAVSIRKGLQASEPLDEAGRKAMVEEAEKILTFDLSGQTLKGYWVHQGAVQWIPDADTIDLQVISHSARFLIHRNLAHAYDLTGDKRFLNMFHVLMADVVWEFPGNVMQRWFTTRTHWGIDALDVAIRTRHAMACAAYLAGPHPVDADIMQLLWRMLYWCGARGQEFYHTKNHNIAFYEAGEQARIGFYFSAFKEAQSWREGAQRRMIGSLAGSVMADGSNVEASTNYHFQYLYGPIAIADACADTGIPLLPEFQSVYREAAACMLDSWAKQTTPNRALHPQGDGWHHPLGLTLAKYGRQLGADFSVAVASADPAQWPVQKSFYLPVQRYAAMRASWAPDALWAGFSLRGFHEGHDHRDMFHVELQSGSRRLLLDSGVIDYHANRERSRASKAHNVLVVENQDHRPGSATDIRWYSHENFDFCEGAASIHPDVLHRRALCFIRPGVFVILDRVSFLNPAPRPLDFAFYYHLPVGAQVSISPAAVETTDADQPNLRMDFALDAGWSLSQEIGFIAQGYMKEVPGPVAVLSSKTDKPFTLATVLRAGHGLDAVCHQRLPVTLANAERGEALSSAKAIALTITQDGVQTTLLWAETGLGRKSTGNYSTDGDLLIASTAHAHARRAVYVHRDGASAPFEALRDMSELI